MGSRNSDGNVPNVNWNTDNRKLHVNWNNPDNRNDNLRARAEVSEQIKETSTILVLVSFIIVNTLANRRSFWKSLSLNALRFPAA